MNVKDMNFIIGFQSMGHSFNFSRFFSFSLLFSFVSFIRMHKKDLVIFVYAYKLQIWKEIVFSLDTHRTATDGNGSRL